MSGDAGTMAAAAPATSTMTAWPMMAEAQAWFAARLLAEPDCLTASAPDAGPLPAGVRWSNLVLSSPRIRRAHVELFEAPGRVCVLHVCVFAPLDDARAVFGFDMIAGLARVTGIFLDLSPVRQGPPVPRLAGLVAPARLAAFAERRALPDWAAIFSADMLAIRPVDMAEVARAIGLACAAFDGFLSAPAEPGRPDAIAAGQSAYAAAQRRNDHTFRMLAGFVGPERARRFIDEVLFPPIDQTPRSLGQAA